MKKIVSLILILLLVPALACAEEKKTITVGVSPFPHRDIMLIAKPLLEQQGYTVIIKDFTDYVLPNMALADGSLDANFFQHIPYLEVMSTEQKLDLVWVAKVHIEPLGLYSKKVSELDALQAGNTIAVPNDPTNCARALRLLEANGLFTFTEGELITARDVVENPKKLRIIEIEAAQLPRTLPDVTAAVINSNFAGEAGLIPSSDAIVIEGEDSPYANVIAVRAADAQSPAIKALVAAITSPEVKAYIEKELLPKGIVPAF